jgi:acetyl esterase/lipase
MLLAKNDAGAEPRVESNVAYGLYSGLALLMDVHHPRAPNGYGVVFVAGSGWNAPLEYGAQGLKDEEEQLVYVHRLADAGYTVFTINHRAAPRFHFPAQLDDVQRAIRFVRHSAKHYGIDPNRIGGVGGSSGGHLISLVAMLGAPEISDDADPINREPATIQCLVVRAPPVDMKVMSHLSESRGLPAAISFLGLALPIDDRSNEKLFAASSPISHVSRQAPPVLLIHGDADRTVPYQQSVAMEAALRAVNVQVTLLRIPGGDHGPDFGAAGKPHAEWPDYLGEMVQWLDRYLKTGPAVTAK